MGKAPNTYADASVWATGSRYYIDGTVKVLSKKDFENGRYRADCQRRG